MTLLSSILRFLARLFVVCPLLKSSAEIVIINEQTPKLMVDRFSQILRFLQSYVYLDQDVVLRFLFVNQKTLSLAYGLLILMLCTLVVLNYKKAINMLITMIILSMGFFYVEFESIGGASIN